MSGAPVVRYGFIFQMRYVQDLCVFRAMPKNRIFGQVLKPPRVSGGKGSRARFGLHGRATIQTGKTVIAHTDKSAFPRLDGKDH
jgi:hypothetical protein